jgi:hypothetical protein
LEAAPGTAAALRAGALSTAQAEHISLAVAADPREEERLLRMAGTHSLRKLRDECARVRLAADADPEATRARIRRGRSWRRWTDADGSRCGSYRLTPEEGAELEALAQPFIDARLDEARRAGEHEPSEAYAADGLMAMARAAVDRGGDGGRGGDDDDGATDGRDGRDAPSRARGGRGRKRFRDRRELLALVNIESLRRGSVEPGEVCEIAGVGPVSLQVVRELFGDALLRIVIRDGVDVTTVVHTGRTASAVQETGVLARSMGLCEIDGCDLSITEIDHADDFARAGPASLDGLTGLCGHHHDRKTRGRGTYRRMRGGGVEWIPPP